MCFSFIGNAVFCMPVFCYITALDVISSAFYMYFKKSEDIKNEENNF